jgi:type II secretory ATPase GspE/PulE/Tfp pilus assembly ATPase PilB-like protein
VTNKHVVADAQAEAKLDPHLLKRVELILNQIPATSKIIVPKQWKFYHSPGCKECHNLGYQGRIGIYEVLEVDKELADKINARATASDIKAHAVEHGMITMLQDGLIKAKRGITTIEEVLRATRD